MQNSFGDQVGRVFSSLHIALFFEWGGLQVLRIPAGKHTDKSVSILGDDFTLT